MTYEEKISWLSRYREAEKLYQRLSYRLAEAQEATRHITQNLSAAPGGSKDGQSLARAVEREEEAERRAYAQLAVLDALFAEIDAVLVQLSMFQDDQKDRARKLDQTVDQLRSKFGVTAISRGSVTDTTKRVGRKYKAQLDDRNKK